MHPASLSQAELLADCTIRYQRRGGPGGQHRNKVETAVVIQHQPTGISSEANERRSRVDNQRVAIFRLRLKLAVGVRSNVDTSFATPSLCWARRNKPGAQLVAAEHEDCPTLIAELLDWIHACDFDLDGVSRKLNVSKSRMVRLLHLYPPALASLNIVRQQRNLSVLK